MTRVAIIAALPAELRPLVRGWTHESRRGVELWRRRQGESVWLAACAGIGAEAARRALAEVEAEGLVAAICSVGWAGSLQPWLGAGRVYRVAGVIDARTGERFPAAWDTDAGACWLVTSARVADQAEKRRLAAIPGAGLVDMEAAALARRAAELGVPFHGLKGVSDGPADRLPDFNAFIATDGTFASFRFGLFTALRPWHWGAVLRLGRHSRRAARGFPAALHAMGGELGA
jgi:adenosylhomocysteine nucleosidase